MAVKVKVDNKTNKDNKQSVKLQKKSGGLLKIIVILVILVILIAAGFAVGIYLKFIDGHGLVDRWNLSQYPVIGQYFSPPKTNFESVELGKNSAVDQPIVPAVVPPAAMLPEVRKIDDVEFQKQLKLKQQEEAKRISKVSRLYGTMKPDEAVAILDKMDDETVLLILNKMEDEPVAKIMALFDARRAAVLSQGMLRGRSTN